MKERYIADKIELAIQKNRWDQAPYYDLLALCKSMSNKKLAHVVNRELRKMAADIIADASFDQKLWLLDVRKQSLLFDAPVDFDAYLQYVEFDRDSAKRFYLPRRSVLYPVVSKIQDLMDDKLDLLTISMPPGVGKSTLGIFLLSWVMGKWPHSPSLASAHSGTLTRSFYDGVQQILTDSEYLWRDVFPDATLVSTNAQEETLDLVKRHRFSTLTCRAINASLTGATRCEKLLYADDLVSGIEEAMSKERLDKLWITYTNDLKSRKKQGAKELHVATRWSIHDVIGRLEQQYSGNGAPEVVEERIASLLLKHKVQMSRFESNSAGGKVARIIQDNVEERGGITKITTKYTTGNKETKIIVNSPWVKEHCLFRDSGKVERNSDYGKMLWFLTGYTMAGKNKHDDVPDGMAMLAEFATSLVGAKVEVFNRPF